MYDLPKVYDATNPTVDENSRKLAKDLRAITGITWTPNSQHEGGQTGWRPCATADIWSFILAVVERQDGMYCWIRSPGPLGGDVTSDPYEDLGACAEAAMVEARDRIRKLRRRVTHDLAMLDDTEDPDALC